MNDIQLSSSRPPDLDRAGDYVRAWLTSRAARTATIYRESYGQFSRWSGIPVDDLPRVLGSMNKLEVTVDSAERVSFGGLSLACHRHGLAPGTRAVLTLRPEDVIPSEAGQRDAPNRLAVMVRDMEFLGSHWRAWVSSEAFGEKEIDAHFSTNAVRRLSIRAGEALTIELPPERLHVFTPDGIRG